MQFESSTRREAMSKLTVFTPVWAVGPDCDCMSLTPVRYRSGSFTQWGMHVGSMTEQPFVVISLLFIDVVGELSIGTDAREPIVEDVLNEVSGQFKGSKAGGSFHSGPLTALFPHSQFNRAWECHTNNGDPKDPQWEKPRRAVVTDLVVKFGLPLLRFKSYAEVRARCG